MSRMCVKIISLVVLYCWLQVPVGATPDKSYRGTADNTKEEKGDIAYPDDLGIGHGQSSKQNVMFQHHHHRPDFHHHHHPDFHHHYHPYAEESPREEKPADEETRQFNNLSIYNQIPLDYIQDLNQYNVSDLLLNFVEGQDDDTADPFIQNRFGDDEVQEKSAATIPRGSDCLPELRTIQLASSDDPSVLHIPQCTRIERCGGCCRHDLLSCQPLKKENIPFKIFKTQYTGEKKLKFKGTEVIMVEKHNKCKCLCRIKAENCTKFQEYRESECRCACVNYDEKKKCIRNSDIKLWNPELCACQCRDNMQCSTGSYFDQNECRCMPVPRNRVGGNLQRRSFRSEPLPVVPLDEEY